MMRRMLPAAAALMLLLSGCSSGQGSFSVDDLSLTVEGQSFDCETNIETVINALGEDYTYAEGRSCAYDGLDKTYAYSMAEFYTNPLPEGDIVTEIYTVDPSVTTTKGLGIGATRDEVVAAYGKPDEDDGYTLYYRVSDEAGEPALCFDLDGDTVTAITLTRGLI